MQNRSNRGVLPRPAQPVSQASERAVPGGQDREHLPSVYAAPSAVPYLELRKTTPTTSSKALQSREKHVVQALE